ncbi:MAG: hypothetical protein GF331_16840 [Chitinivibrionales bacterium]|nr:hypothetical protein [Chitinivibrionales bacterium]
MDSLTPEFDRLIKAKQERRRRLARLPYPEKVRILVKMQRMAYPLAATRNPRACVWKIIDEER